MEQLFNDRFRKRTKDLAIAMIKFLAKYDHMAQMRVINYQLGKSGTSVAANFRAACISRSQNEYFAKLCIVIEEADESCFWFEMIADLNIINKTEYEFLNQEMLEILKVMSKTRKTLRST